MLALQLAEDYSNLPDLISKYDNILEDAKDDLAISNKTLMQCNSEQPILFAKYNKHHQEIKSLLNVIEIRLEKKKGDLWKKFRETSNVALSTTDLTHWIEGDTQYNKIKIYHAMVVDVVNNMAALMKAFEQRGYVLRNLTDLRVHELHMYVIE